MPQTQSSARADLSIYHALNGICMPSIVFVMHLFSQNFVSDFSAIVTDPTAFNSGEKRNLVNSVICEHFLRQGMLDIAEDLIQVNYVVL